MEKDEFVKFLENKGINAKLEDGVVIILYDGGTLSPSEVYRNTEVRSVSGSAAEKSMSKLIRTKTDL